MRRNFLFLMIMTFGLFISSCTDDNDLSGNIVVEIPDDVDLMSLEAWSYEVPFEVKCDGEWATETTGDWFYLIPENGSGNTTVEICVLDNDSDQRQEGSIKIVTKDGVSSTVNIQQKSLADYASNGLFDKSGNKRYAVGYGYNPLNAYDSPSGVTLPVLGFNGLDNDDLIEFGAPITEFTETIVTGSSLQELSQNLNVSANVSGKYAGFKGEIGATFSGSSYSSGHHEFAISYIYYKLNDISINTSDYQDYITPAAYKAINGVSGSGYEGADGVKKLIEKYGTHVIMSAGIGGKLRTNMSVDITKVTGAYDIGAFAKASYSGFGVSASGSVDAKMQKSYEENQMNINRGFTAYGGNASALALTSDKAAIDEWKNSLVYDDMETYNVALVKLSENSLVSISEFIDVAKYPNREAEVKAYLDGTEFAQAGKVEYDCGTEVEFTIPQFNDEIHISDELFDIPTLVKEIQIDGAQVATICSEFIPVLSKTNRVTVVYPTINNKTMFNMGYFIGNSTHKPARVSWDGNDVTIVEYNEEAMEEQTTVYLKGTNISSTPYTDKVSGTVVDSYLRANNSSEVGNYPLVKILGSTWLRQDFRAKYDITGQKVNCRLNEGARIYYNISSIVDPNLAPEGWRVASSNDFEQVKSSLSAAGFSSIGELFRFGNNSPLGFDALNTQYDGYMLFDGYSYSQQERGDVNIYGTSDNKSVKIKDNAFVVESPTSGYYMSVRLVKE